MHLSPQANSTSLRGVDRHNVIREALKHLERTGLGRDEVAERLRLEYQWARNHASYRMSVQSPKTCCQQDDESHEQEYGHEPARDVRVATVELKSR